MNSCIGRPVQHQNPGVATDACSVKTKIKKGCFLWFRPHRS